MSFQLQRSHGILHFSVSLWFGHEHVDLVAGTLQRRPRPAARGPRPTAPVCMCMCMCRMVEVVIDAVEADPRLEIVLQSNALHSDVDASKEGGFRKASILVKVDGAHVVEQQFNLCEIYEIKVCCLPAPAHAVLALRSGLRGLVRRECTARPPHSVVPGCCDGTVAAEPPVRLCPRPLGPRACADRATTDGRVPDGACQKTPGGHKAYSGLRTVLAGQSPLVQVREARGCA